MTKTNLLSLLIGLLFTLPLLAQGELTEEEINREKLFIEANREKLMGNYTEAIGMLRELYRQDGENAAVAFELGRLLQAEGQLEEAIDRLREATELDPANEWYPRFLADIYQQEGRNADGAAMYERLATQQPDDQYLAFRWAYFLVKNQEVDKAIKVYEDLEKRIGLNEEIARRKHTLFLGMGDYKRAARTLVDLTEAFPDVLEYQHLLAAFYESQDDRNNADKVYRRILEMAPEDPKAQIALAGGSNIQNDDLRYLADLRLSFERPDVSVDLKVGKLYPFITKVVETNNPVLADAALELTTVMEQVHGSDAKVYAAAGDLLYHSGRRKEAIVKYRATLDRDDNVFPVWEQLLVCLYEIGEGEGLYQAAKNALDVFPNRAVVQYYLALGADATERYDDALDAVNMVRLMSGRDPGLQADAYALEGQILQHQGDNNEANKAFERAAELAPQSLEYNYRHSQFLLAQGDLKAARTLADQAAAADPRNPYYTSGLARVLYAQERYQDAKEQISLALPQGAEHWPSALELAGDTQFQLKQTDQAVSYWERALGLDDNERLREKITNKGM